MIKRDTMTTGLLFCFCVCCFIASGAFMAATFALGADSSHCRQLLKISDRRQRQAAEGGDMRCKVTPGGGTHCAASDMSHSHRYTVG